MAKIGVVLSGCGVYDGSEIHEAVITLLSFDKRGAEVIMMAPDTDQMHVVNHLTGQPAAGEKRNVLVESARIARGNILDIAEVKADEIDALFFPGGFGAAKNLSDFAVKGAEAALHPEVARLIEEVQAAGKWIGAVCISPAIIAKAMQNQGVEKAALTVGAVSDASKAMEAMGATHVVCAVTEFHVDEKNKVITAPAYMYDARISEVAAGIEKAVGALLDAVGS